MEFKIFPPGTTVWVWTTTIKEPVELIVEEVDIFVKEWETRIHYLFKPNTGGHIGRQESDTVFATQAEAIAFRENYIAEIRKSMGIA